MKFLRRFQILILISVICIVSGELEVQDKCGIVGAYSLNKSKNVSRDIYYGLYALQHRGQESAGISSHNGRHVRHREVANCIVEEFEKKERSFGTDSSSMLRKKPTSPPRSL